jgi:hypothetical protein
LQHHPQRVKKKERKKGRNHTPTINHPAPPHLQRRLIKLLIQHRYTRLKLPRHLQRQAGGQAGQGDGEQPVLVQHGVDELSVWGEGDEDEKRRGV